MFACEYATLPARDWDSGRGDHLVQTEWNPFSDERMRDERRRDAAGWAVTDAAVLRRRLGATAGRGCRLEVNLTARISLGAGSSRGRLRERKGIASI